MQLIGKWNSLSWIQGDFLLLDKLVDVMRGCYEPIK